MVVAAHQKRCREGGNGYTDSIDVQMVFDGYRIVSLQAFEKAAFRKLHTKMQALIDSGRIRELIRKGIQISGFSSWVVALCVLTRAKRTDRNYRTQRE